MEIAGKCFEIEEQFIYLGRQAYVKIALCVKDLLNSGNA
jgi:hypothetical protein